MFEPDSDSPRGDAPSNDRLPPLVRVIFYLPAYLFAQLVTSAVMLAVWLALTGRTQPEPTFEPSLAMILAMSAAFFPCMVIGTGLFVRGLDRRRLADLGWRLPAGFRRLTLQAVLAVAGASAVLLLWLAVGRFAFTVNFGGLAELGRNGVPSAASLAVYFGGFALAAAIEELGFRGYVFHALKERGGAAGHWAGAAGLQAALFAALHASNPEVSVAGIFNTFLLGLGLAALVEVTGSLFASTVAHATWNFVVALGLPISGLKSFGALRLAVDGPVQWTGGAYGPEGSWLLTGLMVVAVLGLALWADHARSARGEAPVVLKPDQAP